MEQRIIKREAYHIQVYEIVKNQILNRKLPSGEKINENALAQSLGISRSPVREALRMLEQDELVVPSSNGLIVNPLNVENMKDVYECRMVLESYAARLSAATLSEEDLSQLESYVNQAMSFHNIRNTKKVVQINTAFHDSIIEGCHNTYLKTMIERNRSLSVLARTQEFSAYKRDASYLTEHMDIVRALQQRDGDLAEKLMRRHIQGDLAFYLSQVEKKSHS